MSAATSATDRSTSDSARTSAIRSARSPPRSRTSRDWRTWRCSAAPRSTPPRPVGPPQPEFRNAVVRLVTGRSPESLLAALLEVERAHGRVRAERWGPRLLDLDILLWGDRVVDAPGLRIPHPELHRRRFALEPLAELDPGGAAPRSPENGRRAAGRRARSAGAAPRIRRVETSMTMFAWPVLLVLAQGQPLPPGHPPVTGGTVPAKPLPSTAPPLPARSLPDDQVLPPGHRGDATPGRHRRRSHRWRAGHGHSAPGQAPAAAGQGLPPGHPSVAPGAAPSTSDELLRKMDATPDLKTRPKPYEVSAAIGKLYYGRARWADARDFFLQAEKTAEPVRDALPRAAEAGEGRAPRRGRGRLPRLRRPQRWRRRPSRPGASPPRRSTGPRRPARSRRWARSSTPPRCSETRWR